MPLSRLTELQFQSTLPHGSDRLRMQCQCRPKNFNPRSLTGATDDIVASRLLNEISIHAPSRERLPPRMFLDLRFLFQSTLPHGSDLYCIYDRKGELIFQSTLPHGSDITQSHGSKILNQISIHAPSRERPAGYNLFRSPTLISIHAPSRERRQS